MVWQNGRLATMEEAVKKISRAILIQNRSRIIARTSWLMVTHGNPPMRVPMGQSLENQFSAVIQGSTKTSPTRTTKRNDRRYLGIGDLDRRELVQQFLGEPERAQSAAGHAPDEAADQRQVGERVVRDRPHHHEVLHGPDGAREERRWARVAVQDRGRRTPCRRPGTPPWRQTPSGSRSPPDSCRAGSTGAAVIGHYGLIPFRSLRRSVPRPREVTRPLCSSVRATVR